MSKISDYQLEKIVRDMHNEGKSIRSIAQFLNTQIPKDDEQIKAMKLEYRKRIIIHRIHNFNLNDYPLEVLEKVYIELGGN